MKNKIFMNRELSWLKFNERVLEEAESSKNPLCERLTFLSIYQSNLDEFFMVRIGSLADQLIANAKIRDNKSDMTPEEQINAAVDTVRGLEGRRNDTYSELMKQMKKQGVSLTDFKHMTMEEIQKAETIFETRMLPLLSPIVVNRRNPFPFMRNKEIYAICLLEGRKGKKSLGVIGCGNNVFPRLTEVSEKRFILSEELILHYVSKVFSAYAVKEKSLIRVTRSADIDADALYDEELDYRDFMEEIIQKRKMLSPVRLELTRELDSSVVEKICDYIGVKKHFVFINKIPLDLSFVFQMQDVVRTKENLFYQKSAPQQYTQFSKDAILPQIKEKDRLLSYPYDSISPFLRMLREAAHDKDVVAIKMTLYRVAKNSEVVESLIEAAENGKDVLVLVELKARFDEENNISWSRRLESAGCTVIYGLNGFKVHSKLCLIVRNENGNPAYYTQVGTGNYNEKTSRLYTDYSLMTYNQKIGQNALEVFNALASNTTVQNSTELLVAPNCLQNRIIDMIDEQIKLAEKGYIGMKMNSMTDKKIMEKFVEASNAGVKIELVIRGICCLRPNVPEKTENIRIISIVGRYLEHSRIYMFGTGKEQKMYIASADLMTRNTLKRVEVAVPIYDEDIKTQISYMFSTMLSDNVQAREMQSDGTYIRVKNHRKRVNSQEVFSKLAYEKSEQRKLTLE